MSKQGKAEQVGISEGNRLIAEFLEWEVAGSAGGEVVAFYYPENHPTHTGITTTDPDGLGFHRRWDDLMRAVEKIELLQYDTKIGCLSKISNGIKATDQIVLIETPTGNEISCVTGESKIESVWLAVVSFIQWHNQQSLTP